MRCRTIPAGVFALTLTLAGCSSDSGPNQSGAIQYDPPNTTFAGGLGITTPPPVTAEEAMAIAAEAAGGTAIEVESETEDGELIYEVEVAMPGGESVEVEVRASDGGVIEIEADDDDDQGEDEDDGEDDGDDEDDGEDEPGDDD